MGKKNEKRNKEYSSGDIIRTVTDSLNKKGKIKGKNKHEQKMLIYACPHNKLNKNGKVIPTLKNRGSMLKCDMCGASFSGKIYTDEQLRAALEKTMNVAQQMKFLMPALKSDAESARFITNFAVSLERIPKIYKRIRKVAQKQRELGNKKNKKQNRDSGQYGDWRASR